MKNTAFRLHAILLAFAFMAGCSDGRDEQSLQSANSAPSDIGSIIRFCADCHELPNPASFEKSRWHEEVEQGIRIYNRSGRSDLVIPDLEATVAFFRDQAPDDVVIEPPDRKDDTRFIAKTLVWPGAQRPTSISSILAIDKKGSSPCFLLTDMSNGALSQVTAIKDGINVDELGDVAHPAHIEPCDLNQDGETDYIVADLATLSPQDEKQGSIWWFVGQAGQPLKRHALKLGLSRVADVRPIDYDNDGDLDLIAGDFGLHFVGSIYLGSNGGLVDGIPKFEWKVIDTRPGAISLPTVDFDRDGRTDFVALIAQQYETVELKLNRGGGEFESKVIYAAGDPSFGTSSMELVDFDGDDDLDVLYTNGDTFDDTLAKPHHGMKWLENEGVFPFTVHDIAGMPGCYRAVSGDIDKDGDLDVAAVSYLSKEEVAKFTPNTFDAVAWFEQQADGSFLRHTMVKNVCQAATCMLLDWDRDGDLDLLVPPSITDRNAKLELTVYVNQTSGSEPSNALSGVLK